MQQLCLNFSGDSQHFFQAGHGVLINVLKQATAEHIKATAKQQRSNSEAAAKQHQSNSTAISFSTSQIGYWLMQSLSLAGCTKVSDEAVAAVALHGNLQYLSVQGVPSIGASTMKALATATRYHPPYCADMSITRYSYCQPSSCKPASQCCMPFRHLLTKLQASICVSHAAIRLDLCTDRANGFDTCARTKSDVCLVIVPATSAHDHWCPSGGVTPRGHCTVEECARDHA